MTLHWPQVTFFAISFVSIVFGAALHGTPRKDSWNVVVPLVNAAFNAWLLWCGGFFG